MHRGLIGVHHWGGGGVGAIGGSPVGVSSTLPVYPVFED